jgi:uncharacterized membrane protein (UPF0127 family)
MRKSYILSLSVLVLAVLATYFYFMSMTHKGAETSAVASSSGEAVTQVANSGDLGSSTSTEISASGTPAASALGRAATSSADAPSSQFLSVGSAKIRIGIAQTEADRERGLSGRASLGADEGLFFIGDAPDYIGIWMKDMNFPIDVIWFDSDMKVIYIIPDMEPSSYPSVFYPKSLAKYVLEVNAGTVQNENIKIGQTAKLTTGQ